MKLLLFIQKIFLKASFIVGDAAEYFEKACSLYIKWINQTFNTDENAEQLSIAPIVDGINYKLRLYLLFFVNLVLSFGLFPGVKQRFLLKCCRN